MHIIKFDRLVFCCFIITGLLLAPTVNAHGEEPQESGSDEQKELEKKAETQKKRDEAAKQLKETGEAAKCGEPEVILKNADLDNVILLIRAEPEGEFKFSAHYMVGDKSAGSGEKPTHPPMGKKILTHPAGKIRATKTGGTIHLAVTEDELLQHSGKIIIELESTKDEDCAARRFHHTNLFIFNKHFARLDIGSIFTLQGSGQWEQSIETAFTAQSQWLTWFSTGVNVRYIFEVKTEGEQSEEGEVNPFATGTGIFNLDGYGNFRPYKENIGLVIGIGFQTTVSEEENAPLDSTIYYYAGLKFSVERYGTTADHSFLNSARGFFQLGITQNDIFADSPDELDGDSSTTETWADTRFFAEGELHLQKTDNVRLRLYTSGPMNPDDDGPTIVMISALYSFNPFEQGVFKK